MTEKYRLFDAHSDLFEDVDEKRERGLTNIIDNGHVRKWEEGGCAGGFCPVWVDPFCEVYDMPVREQAERIIRHMKEELSACESVAAVTSAAAFEEAVSNGRHAIILGTEGLSFLHGDHGGLEGLYETGMREFSLTWNEENEFAGGAGSDPSRGLTAAGKECVRRIRSLNAILDLAHASKQTFYDAVSVIDGPFMVSHANVGSLHSHPRNLTDDQLRIVGEFDGVMGISAYGPFISNDREGMTLQRYCDNIEYAASLIGIDHVGLGFDFVDFLDDVGEDESISYVVRGLEDISKGQAIASELASRGFTTQDIEKVYYGNFLRLIRTVLG